MSDEAVIENTDYLYSLLIRLIEKTSLSLYRHTIERLKKINPTLEEIAELCTIFITILQNAGEHKSASAIEAVSVIKEAADAVRSNDEKTITDCAYHLEDFISRFKTEIN